MTSQGNQGAYFYYFRLVGCAVFYAVRVVTKQSLWVSLCLPLMLQGNGSIKTFQWRGFLWGPCLSKESRRLVLIKTSCFLCRLIASLYGWMDWMCPTLASERLNGFYLYSVFIHCRSVLDLNVPGPNIGDLQMNPKTQNGDFLENDFDQISVVYVDYLPK
jgi:hypothetical protein